MEKSQPFEWRVDISYQKNRVIFQPVMWVNSEGVRCWSPKGDDGLKKPLQGCFMLLMTFPKDKLMNMYIFSNKNPKTHAVLGYIFLNKKPKHSHPND